MPSDLITPRVAAEMLAVNKITLARWAEQGKIRRATLPGGHHRYFRSEIEALMVPVEESA